MRGRPRGRLRGTTGGPVMSPGLKLGWNVVAVEPLAARVRTRVAGCVLGRAVRVGAWADGSRPSDFDRGGKALAVLVFGTPRGGPTFVPWPGSMMGNRSAAAAAARDAERPRRTGGPTLLGPDSMRAVDDRARLRADVLSRRGISGEGDALRPLAGVLRLPRLMLRVRGVWARPRDTLRVRRGTGGGVSSSSSSSGTGTRMSI